MINFKLTLRLLYKVLQCKNDVRLVTALYKMFKKYFHGFQTVIRCDELIIQSNCTYTSIRCVFVEQKHEISHF